ncbi:hypothetical protein D3C86_1329990 [compost metagenome]
MLQRHHGMNAGNTKVIAVFNRYPSGTGITGFCYRNLHGIWCYDKSEAPIAVHHCSRGRFMHDPDLRSSIYPAYFPKPHIADQPGNTMTVYTPEVGAE